MALIDARQRRWIVAEVLLLAAATAGYVGSRRCAGPERRGRAGPVVRHRRRRAHALEVALNLRKRVPTRRIGRAETWLRSPDSRLSPQPGRGCQP